MARPLAWVLEQKFMETHFLFGGFLKSNDGSDGKVASVRSKIKMELTRRRRSDGIGEVDE